MKKKMLSLLLVVTMPLSLVPTMALATDETAAVSHFQFKPNYAGDYLTLNTNGVTTTFEHGDLQMGTNDIYVFSTSGDYETEVGEAGVVIATMTFTANATTPEAGTTVSLINVA